MCTFTTTICLIDNGISSLHVLSNDVWYLKDSSVKMNGIESDARVDTKGFSLQLASFFARRTGLGLQA